MKTKLEILFDALLKLTEMRRRDADNYLISSNIQFIKTLIKNELKESK